MPILCRFVSGFPKRYMFWRTTIINAKSRLSNKWHHHLYLVFRPSHSQKYRYWPEILYTCCWLIALYYKFWLLDFCIFYFKSLCFTKINILNLRCQNIKRENRESRFEGHLILHLWHFSIAFYFRPYSLGALKTGRFFNQNRMTQRH